jgi:tetratricopeptide (TPR) repeat protein
MSEAEATKLVREAEQAEAKKNVFFQPRPDWEKAADCYQKAALILRSPALKKTDAAVCAFDKASVAHAKCGAKFFAGVALENAANVLRDARCLSAAAAKYAQASEMFLLGDNIEKGSEALIKAAKASAEEQPDFAIQYYLDVIAIFEESDKHVYISDTWRSALGLMLRRGRLEDAAKLLQRMCPTFARLEQADYLYKAQLRCQSCVLTAHLSVLPPANYPRACPLCKVDATPPCSPLFPS